MSEDLNLLKEWNAWLYFFLPKSQRGDSGRNQTCAQIRKAGRHAEPSIRRQLRPVISGLFGTFWNTRELTVPNMIPKAVHICHIMTRPPRMEAGAHSAAKTGTVALFGPIPIPRIKRAALWSALAGDHSERS
jgi:hypothetical protein